MPHCALHRLKAEIESLSLKNEQLQYEHSGQLDELQHELADLSEHSESTRRKLEREKNSLEAELTKALQDLVTVKTVTVDNGDCHVFVCYSVGVLLTGDTFFSVSIVALYQSWLILYGYHLLVGKASLNLLLRLFIAITLTTVVMVLKIL